MANYACISNKGCDAIPPPTGVGMRVYPQQQLKVQKSVIISSGEWVGLDWQVEQWLLFLELRDEYWMIGHSSTTMYYGYT